MNAASICTRCVYVIGRRKERSKLLDEMEAVTELHRKSLLRLIHGDLARPQLRRKTVTVQNSRPAPMTFAEVDDLNGRINLQALRDYASTVQARTRAIVQALDPNDLDGVIEAERLRVIVVDEGLAGPQKESAVVAGGLTMAP